MATSTRYRRSVLDRLMSVPVAEPEGLMLSYNVEQLRDAVARDVEALLNTRSAIDFEDIRAYPNARRSVFCFGIRDFVGKVLTNSEDQRFIAESLVHAIESFEKRLRNVRIEFHERPGALNSLSFTIRALLIAYPAAEPVAFDAVMQPSLSRFSVSAARFSGGSAKV